MSQKKIKALKIINILTISFILIALQSGVARFEKLADSWTLEEKILFSIQDCDSYGWSRILYPVVPLSKFPLFIASIYAVIAETIGIAKKSLPPKYVGLILVKILFIVLCLVQIYDVVYMVMMG